VLPGFPTFWGTVLRSKRYVGQTTGIGRSAWLSSPVCWTVRYL